MRQPLLILVTISLLVFSGARAQALAGLHPKLDPQNIGGWSMALGALSLAGYYMYKNSPRARAEGYREEMGPGEWYFGGYLGYSYLPPMDWKLTSPANDKQPLGPTAKNIIYRPGVQGGLKFGRYLDRLPWFGIEGETNLSRNVIPGSQGKLFPPQPGLQNPVLGGKDYFLIWTMQLNLLARYGFFKDKEVTFGRLQPYVGIGPGWEVIYGKTDSAKNFAIEALGGIRYKFTEKISLFFEYKYSYQFNILYEQVRPNKNGPDTNFLIDFPHHRFVIGVSYHFKNLYGN
jgi:opacity protein-like surface antigen